MTAGPQSEIDVKGEPRSPRHAVPITVRRPKFDYKNSPRVWTPKNPTFGYRMNGGSLTLPYLEPYLIRVMRQAKEALGDRATPELLADIDLFNAQEANHFRLHAEYNTLLRSRYEGIAALEAEIKADFDRMLREESLLWNLGYSAGFETTGMAIAQTFFEGAKASLADADPAVAGLWGWHLAEEYEHRCVAIEVFRALGGGYVDRVKMFVHQARHLNGFGARAAAMMQAQDERDGHFTPAPEGSPEYKEQKAREVRQGRYAMLRILRSLLPFHDPRRHAPLVPGDRFLAELAWD